MDVSYFSTWDQIISMVWILAIILFFYSTFWYVIALIFKRNDVADLAWGLGFIVVALSSLWLGQGLVYFRLLPRMILVAILVILWGGRLAWHIFKRLRSHEEDPRYKNWRKTWRAFYLRSYLQVFLLQTILLFIISTPVIFIMAYSGRGLHWLDYIAVVLWCIGFFFEVTADKQLKQFISKPENAGKLLTTGLWKYSRHPNYFGEALMWWSIWLLALSVPYGWMSIIGPLTITGLLLFVSGVPLSEKRMVSKPGWDEYKKRTSVFFPLPPKK